MTQAEQQVSDLVNDLDIEAMTKGPQVNLIDIIAAHRGWNPLVIGESMTVGFNGQEYKITRNKNRY